MLILWFLAEREHTVSKIAAALGASLSCTSQHLHLMELNDVLEFHREKQNIYFRLSDNNLLRHCLVLANLPKDKLAELMPEPLPSLYIIEGFLPFVRIHVRTPENSS